MQRTLTLDDKLRVIAWLYPELLQEQLEKLEEEKWETDLLSV